MGLNFFNRDDRDMRFVLFEWLDMEKVLGYEKFSEFALDDFAMMFDEAYKIARDFIGPTFKDGDEIGVKYEGGQVTVPPSFHEAFKAMAENGWIGLASPPEYGGQGMPAVVSGVINEFFNAAHFAFMTYVGLLVSNSGVIVNYGTDKDKEMFVERMITGEFGGTMCLTEPDAGSDVGDLLTKATPDPDAGDPRIYKIEGSKRFITCGRHDMVDVIIHLVLARIEGAPKGTKGISLFIVPTKWVNEDGSIGEDNDVFCTGIEHKMGIHGSATCSLSFGENGKCRGILLGEPNSGMAKMFQMMNEARIGCGVQANAAAAAAYDAALQYAKERVQGPPFVDRSKPRVPIIQHEDVRRMLMNLKAGTEAARAMIAYNFWMVDVAHNDPDPEVRKAMGMRSELMTPLLKSYITDMGAQLCRDAMQILGGVGYCAEFPIEQHYRDIKILSIWEGTNFIQSLDLVGRKLAMAGGSVYQNFLKEIFDYTAAYKEDPDFAKEFKMLFKAAQATGDISMKYMTYFKEGKIQLIPLSSTRFLDCLAEVTMAYLMLQQGLIARDKLAEAKEGSANHAYYTGKVASVKYFCNNFLPNIFARHTAISQEDTSAIDIPEASF
ncbi:acyl-CoA dehydrogenase domain protein [Desulfarculus baarsii DSM 2075]|uniref:Acyl-CoA dehydrogenase domain protein n=1 Tax=Desulfarculus baarsii (strain ATCC 33931 / DSM 2075 / LMG 7858 / VKM B-1802 / 2st14) TaxID=644282 RepID=E1QH77_DESB2|nr:acyl-CoA dehydrogenase [Desulfarculus baarsii]ADK84920.1 acyl-CoA dehydrogenase domain protein [Desulfarculus baarsii DSM 2075]